MTLPGSLRECLAHCVETLPPKPPDNNNTTLLTNFRKPSKRRVGSSTSTPFIIDTPPNQWMNLQHEVVPYSTESPSPVPVQNLE